RLRSVAPPAVSYVVRPRRFHRNDDNRFDCDDLALHVTASHALAASDRTAMAPVPQEADSQLLSYKQNFEFPTRQCGTVPQTRWVFCDGETKVPCRPLIRDLIGKGVAPAPV